MATIKSTHELEDTMTNHVLQALASTKYACSSLQRFTGGTSAFTYRGTLTKPLPGASTIVIKHTEPYIALNPAWPLDASRSDYETIMLKALSHNQALSSAKYGNYSVQAPRIFMLEPEQPHTLLTQDLTESVTLKDYFSHAKYQSYLKADHVEALGLALGKWLLSLHQWGNTDSPETNELRAKIDTNPMKTLKYQINIGRYLQTVDHFPEFKWADRAVYEKIDERIKKGMDEEGSLVHGDFWAGNILLKDAPPSTWSTTNPCDVFVVDFEFSHLGNVAQDLGQCFAELYLIYYFLQIPAAVVLISSIAEGYCAGPGKSEALAFQVAMHFGIHIAIWPWRVGNWKESPLLPACIAFGDQCLIRGHGGDREWFRGGVLDAIFP